MSIDLFDHNRQAYEAVVEMLAETGKAAVIHPTGTGKSFIGFKLCEDNPDKTICWISPSEYIFRTQLENLAAVSDGYQPENIIFFTYAKLMNLSEEELSEIQADFIVLDEFHRCGADMWGAGVHRLLKLYANSPILGLTATAIRYLDNQRDMADELFDNNIASEMTLGEAIVRGILNPPKYVLSIYSYSKDLEKYEKRIKSAKSKAVRDEAAECLETLKRALENAEGLDVIFDKHMTDRYGKYIIFTPNYEAMQAYMELTEEWFGRVDSHPHIYSVYSDDPTASKLFREFKEDASDHLKLLYCIDALNEGVHVEDVSGVILLRPTVSPIIYKQQIGRALSASKSKAPVIFDIVNNIENLYSIDAVQKEMRTAITYLRSHDRSEAVINDTFEIVDKVEQCRLLFSRLETTLGASWELMYALASEYYAEHGNIDIQRRYVTPDGHSLGQWIHTQRLVRAGKVNGVLTNEQIRKLDQLGMCWESAKDVSWQRYYEAACSYYQVHGELNPKAAYVTEDGLRLGSWLAQLRTYRKSGFNSSYLTIDRIKMLDDIGMVWSVNDYSWERNYLDAVAYYQKYGNLDVPANYESPNGIKLGAWLNKIRSQINGSDREKVSDEQIAMLDAIGMRWDSKYQKSWNAAYEELCRYKEKFGTLEIPVAYKTESGLKLGVWLRRQRDAYGKNLSTERIEKLEALGMVWKNFDPWEEKFQLAKEFYENHNHLNVPVDYIVKGVWLSKWLNEQKLIGEGKRKKKLTPEQRENLKSIGMQFGKASKDLIWEQRYEQAKSYFVSHGTLAMPVGYKDSTGKDLSVWVIRQRDYYKKGKLRKEQIQLLSEIGMVWEIDDPFEKGYLHAKTYFENHGNLLVPNGFVCDDGYRLSSWISKTRSNKKNMKQDQVRKLDAIGMVWSVTLFHWEEMYQYAVTYKEQHHNLQIPPHYLTANGKDLYDWYVRQRRLFHQGKLSEYKVQKLNLIGADLNIYKPINRNKNNGNAVNSVV